MTRASATLVLIRTSSAVATRLVHGGPLLRVSDGGTVATIPAGEIVVYSLQARALRCFVFRTLNAPESFSTVVPGVSPKVRLLLHTSTLGRLQRLQQLLAYLERIGRTPSSLSDGFYLRLHTILNGRLPKTRVLRSLLDQEGHVPTGI